MTDRPILFSAPMVRALLAGTKTQTRRVVKPQPPADFTLRRHESSSGWVYAADLDQMSFDRPMQVRWECPYGQPGDRLWVRETFQRFSEDGYTLYKADPEGFKAMNELKHDECLEARWRPSIHMPRAVSRITLDITGVRVERLQDISEADAQAEGAPLELGELERTILGAKAKYRSGFVRLWESINGADSWTANPWVWVVEFKRAV